MVQRNMHALLHPGRIHVHGGMYDVTMDAFALKLASGLIASAAWVPPVAACMPIHLGRQYSLLHLLAIILELVIAMASLVKSAEQPALAAAQSGTRLAAIMPIV